MSNRGSITKVTSDIILDDTIINADIKTTANITRSKMNQTQDLLCKTGSKVDIFDATDTKDIQILHDGTYGKIAVISGDLLNEIVTGILRLYKAGTHSEINIHAGDFGRRLRIYFDGTNFNILFSSGDLIFDSQANIIFNKNLSIKTGKNLLIYGAGGVNYLNLYHDDTKSFILSQTGPLQLQSNSGDVQIAKVGSQQYLKVYASNMTSRLNAYHNTVDARIDTNVGKIILSPFTSLDIDNKPIINVNDFTFAAAKTGFRSFNCYLMRGVTAADEAQRGDDGGSWGLRNNDAGFARRNFIIPLNLPQGSIITNLRVYYKRNDAASSCQVILQRIEHATQTSLTRGLVTLSDVTGAIVFLDDNTMVSEYVNNASCGYQIYAYIDNNDNVADIALVGIAVSFTYDKIYI
jgi:hypothetical protein